MLCLPLLLDVIRGKVWGFCAKRVGQGRVHVVYSDVNQECVRNAAQ